MNYYVEALKKYATFSGRSRRKEYWFFALFNVLISLVAILADVVIGTPTIIMTYGLLYALYGLAVFIPGLAVLVRRLHDTDHSGWCAFLLLIPIVGSIIIIVFLIRPSDPQENKYGRCPLEA